MNDINEQLQLLDYNDYESKGLKMINAFDNIVDNIDHMNLQRELSKVSIYNSLNIKNQDGRLTIQSGSQKITLNIRNSKITPMLGDLYLSGSNKRSVLWYIVKSINNKVTIPGDQWDTYIIDWNQSTYEIGFSKDNVWSYMKVYDPTKWENIYYRNLEVTKYVESHLEPMQIESEIYGESMTSLGYKFGSEVIDQINEAIDILIAYKEIPEFKGYIESLALELVDCEPDNNSDEE